MGLSQTTSLFLPRQVSCLGRWQVKDEMQKVETEPHAQLRLSDLFLFFSRWNNVWNIMTRTPCIYSRKMGSVERENKKTHIQRIFGNSSGGQEWFNRDTNNHWLSVKTQWLVTQPQLQWQLKDRTETLVTDTWVYNLGGHIILEKCYLLMCIFRLKST